jgi:hypothetical protein
LSLSMLCFVFFVIFPCFCLLFINRIIHCYICMCFVVMFYGYRYISIF